MAFFRAMPWHDGEEKIHDLVHVPHADNPTHPMLSPNLARRVAASPMVALGAIDKEEKVWCTVWGGDLPIAQQVARGGVMGIKAKVDASFDPVVQVLYEGKNDGEILKLDGEQVKNVSGLSIHLEERDRVKMFGRMVAGCLDASSDDPKEAGLDEVGKIGKTGIAQLVVHVTQSLGNCPKYINKRSIASHPTSAPQLASEGQRLSPDAIAHVQSSDVFFVASRGPEDMDCNHRGGTTGFLRVEPQPQGDDQASALVWPEYSGNNLYQTLGNIVHDPHVGLCVPNLITGDVLYVSGTAEILLNRDAMSVMSKTKMAVRLTVSDSKFVKQGLMFRGTPSTNNKDVSSSNPVTNRDITDGMSPYNPRIRYLTSELDPTNPTSKINNQLPPDEYRDRGRPNNGPTLSATFIRKQKITPTIFKYGFRLTSSDSHSFDPNMSPLWKPGQYVALDFSDELYMGYSHMRDDEPTALNDDFVRTFTVASKYTNNDGKSTHTDPEFDIVVRNVGTVTKWLSYQNEKAGMTHVGVLGFGGDFQFQQPGESVDVSDKDNYRGGQVSIKNVFIAAGVGITPLLGQISDNAQASSNMKSAQRGKTVDNAVVAAGISSSSQSQSQTEKPTSGDLSLSLNLNLNADTDTNTDPTRSLILLWSIHTRDIDLLKFLLPSLSKTDLINRTSIFVTGLSSTQDGDGSTGKDTENTLQQIESEYPMIKLYRRRMNQRDLHGVEAASEKTDDQIAGKEEEDGNTKGDAGGNTRIGKIKVANWYVCTSPGMRREIQSWLGEGQTVVFENFDY